MNTIKAVFVRAAALLWSAWSACLAAGWSCEDPLSTSTSAARLAFRSLSSVDALAQCNDGSASGYYYQEGSDSSLVLVYLAGGSWCYDAESCAARVIQGCPGTAQWTSCTSNVSFGAECLKTGLFDRNSTLNPTLSQASLVYVPYCTSDAHMGDVPAAHDRGFAFRGARVARAVISDLSSEASPLPLPDGATIIFGGGSAGARGAMTLLDEVAAALPSLVNVVGLLDSPAMVDVAPLVDSFEGFAKEHQQVFALAGAATVAPDDCSLMYGPSGEQWKCIFGQYRLPFVQTPSLVYAFLQDSFQLYYDLGDPDASNLTDAQASYIATWDRLSHVHLRSLPPPVPTSTGAAGGAADAAVTSVFTPACYNHHASESSSWWKITAGSDGAPPTMVQALEHFLSSGERGLWMDECTTVNCGQGC